MELKRISACNYPVREQDLDSIFKLIADSGFVKFDLWGGLPNYSNNPVECDLVKLKQKADAYKIQIANLGAYPGSNFFKIGAEAEFAEMKRTIDNAAFLGARSIRVSPGHGEDPVIIDALIPFFQQSAAYAAAKGVFLGMENHRGSIAGNPGHCMKLVKAVKSPYFGVLYDPANLMACKIDYKDAYRLFRGHVVHVHVKDSRWVNDKYMRTMLGAGDIDYAWVVQGLEADGYTGDYALEYEIEKEFPVAEGLPKWLEHFRKL